MAPCVTAERSRNSVQNDNPNEEIFPCNDPVHQHMRNPMDRQATFNGWPGNISATNEQMAQAGLFYTGAADKTKCFYCNGGLHNWVRDDDPMVEHAKWFPECEYVLQKRGVEFVSSISSKFPGLNRPPMQPRSWYTTNPGNVVTVSNTSIIYPGATFGSYNDIPPRSPRQNSFQNALQHELTSNMRALGYQEDLLRKVIVRRLETLDMFNDTFEFLDAIETMQNELKSLEHQQLAAQSNTGRSHIQVPERSVEVRIKEIEEERRCKVCLDRESDCVFGSCGHLCTCMECASKLRSCPMCRKRISNAMKIYLA